MPECDLLCNTCLSPGGKWALFPNKASCARQKASTGVPASDVSLCPSLAAGCSQSLARAGPKHIPSLEHLGVRCIHLWGLGESPVPALAPGLCSTAETEPSAALFTPEGPRAQMEEGELPLNSVFRGAKGSSGCGEQSHSVTIA